MSRRFEWDVRFPSGPSVAHLAGSPSRPALLHTYLAQELTVIMKAVLPGRGLSIALRLG